MARQQAATSNNVARQQEAGSRKQAAESRQQEAGSGKRRAMSPAALLWLSQNRAAGCPSPSATPRHCCCSSLVQAPAAVGLAASASVACMRSQPLFISVMLAWASCNTLSKRQQRWPVTCNCCPLRRTQRCDSRSASSDALSAGSDSSFCAPPELVH